MYVQVNGRSDRSGRRCIARIRGRIQKTACYAATVSSPSVSEDRVFASATARTIIGSARPRMVISCSRTPSNRMSCCLANFVRQHDLAFQRLCHVLQSRSDIDRVSQRGEDDMIAVADVADDHFAAMNADPEPDRLAQIMAEEFVRLIDIRGDHGGRPDRLTAGGFGPDQH